MEIGAQVGELARNYFEGTVNATEIYPDGSQNRTAMLKRTQLLIDAQTPVIAKAAFSYDGNYCALTFSATPPTVGSFLDEIKDIISSISFSPFKVSIKEAEYRYFRADTIDQWEFIE